MKKVRQVFLGPLRFLDTGARGRYLIVLAGLAFAANCSKFTDGAVDLAGCIGKGAREMPGDLNATSRVSCTVRDHRMVTAILSPTDFLSDIQIANLRQMNVPADAIYYTGPDSPAVRHQVGFGPVNVYDAHYHDNRKYSTSTAFGSKVLINRLMAKTADHFTVVMQR